MRMIDADALTDRIKQIASDYKSYGMYPLSFPIEYVIDIVETMPTLTQQNEPLTWDEMCAMGEKPIYIVELEKPQKRYWALACQVSKYGIMLASTIDLNDYGSRELYGKSWLAYRCPPEGET